MDNFEEKLNKIVWQKLASKKKQKKNFSPKFKLFTGIFLIFVCIAAGLFFSPVFKIKKISITGNADISGQKLEAFTRSYFNYNLVFGGSEGNSLFLEVKDLSEKIKTEFPELEEIVMKKDFLNKRTSPAAVKILQGNMQPSADKG